GEADEDQSAIWSLPATGEARVLASAPGGLSVMGLAEDGAVLAATSVLAGGTLEDDAERRAARKDAGRTDIWHTGMPIRLWDHEIGDQSRRLVLVSPEGELTDLAPDAGPVSLLTAKAVVYPDSRNYAPPCSERRRG